jgi:hypothetical protein
LDGFALLTPVEKTSEKMSAILYSRDEKVLFEKEIEFPTANPKQVR